MPKPKRRQGRCTPKAGAHSSAPRRAGKRQPPVAAMVSAGRRNRPASGRCSPAHCRSGNGQAVGAQVARARLLGPAGLALAWLGQSLSPLPKRLKSADYQSALRGGGVSGRPWGPAAVLNCAALEPLDLFWGFEFGASNLGRNATAQRAEWCGRLTLPNDAGCSAPSSTLYGNPGRGQDTIPGTRLDSRGGGSSPTAALSFAPFRRAVGCLQSAHETAASTT